MLTVRRATTITIIINSSNKTKSNQEPMNGSIKIRKVTPITRNPCDKININQSTNQLIQAKNNYNQIAEEKQHSAMNQWIGLNINHRLNS